MYPLKKVLLPLTCATISSCDDFDDICAWGRREPSHHAVDGRPDPSGGVCPGVCRRGGHTEPLP
jgi:hypothetical protein